MTNGESVSLAGRELAASWFGAVVWTALSGPLVWALWHDASLRSSPWALLIGLFVLVGVFLLATTLKLTLGWLRFGRLALELDPSPGSLGGHAGGSIFIPIRHRNTSDYRVTLSCLQSRVSRSRTGKSRSHGVVWSTERIPVVERQGRGVRLRFTFEVPDFLPPTQEPAEDHHYWSVRVRGRVPGVDLDRAFEVPVVQSDTPNIASIPVFGEAPPTGLEDREEGPIRVHRRAEGTVLEYPVGREWGMGLASTLFGAVFMAVPIGMVGVLLGRRVPGAAFELAMGLLALPFIVMFGLVGGFLMLLGLYVLLNGLTVHLSSDEITSTRRLLVFSKTRTASIDQVSGVEMKINGQVGSGAKAKVSYKIVARLSSGGRLPLGDGIRGSVLVSALARLITEATGLTVEEVQRKKRSTRTR